MQSWSEMEQEIARDFRDSLTLRHCICLLTQWLTSHDGYYNVHVVTECVIQFFLSTFLYSRFYCSRVVIYSEHLFSEIDLRHSSFVFCKGGWWCGGEGKVHVMLIDRDYLHFSRVRCDVFGCVLFCRARNKIKNGKGSVISGLLFIDSTLRLISDAIFDSLSQTLQGRWKCSKQIVRT